MSSGRNSYFIVENEGSTFPKETSLPSDIFPEEAPIPSPVLGDIPTSEFSKLKAEIDLIKKYIENLNAENVYERSVSSPKKFQQ